MSTVVQHHLISPRRLEQMYLFLLSFHMHCPTLLLSCHRIAQCLAVVPGFAPGFEAHLNAGQN